MLAVNSNQVLEKKSAFVLSKTIMVKFEQSEKFFCKPDNLKKCV